MTAPSPPSPWFPYASTNVDTATTRLFCLPHAGAGAGTYRPWFRHPPAEVAVIGVQPPGREARFGEPAVGSAAKLVELLTGPLLAHAGERYALFGHSMGGLLAFELAHAMTARGRPPAHLIVSGLSAPHLPQDGGVQVHRLPDDELIAHLGQLEGTRPDLLAAGDLMRSLLPTLRADFAVCETYTYVDRPPLPVPITVLGGTVDPTADAALLGAWAALTASRLRLRTFPGGHFFLLEQPEQVIETVTMTLTESETRSGT